MERFFKILERFFNQIIEQVNDPILGISLKQRKQAFLRINSDSEQQQDDAENRNDIRINPLGSGSDYTPFLQHLGIASANIAFGGEGSGGSVPRGRPDRRGRDHRGACGRRPRPEPCRGERWTCL